MRSSTMTSLFPIIVTAASIAVVSSAVSPANAYSVIRTNAEAGNPSSYLYDVGLHGCDVGRKLDPDVNGAQLLQDDQQTYDAVRVKSKAGFPGGFKNIDVCVFGGKTCNGGDIKEGLQSGGNFDSFTLNLFGNFGEDPRVTLSAFPLKFQTAAGSYEAAGVPEPITVVGSGLALGFGTLFSKESAKKRKKAKVKA